MAKAKPKKKKSVVAKVKDKLKGKAKPKAKVKKKSATKKAPAKKGPPKGTMRLIAFVNKKLNTGKPVDEHVDVTSAVMEFYSQA